VLSESVARGLKQIKGDEASETIRFVEIMDKLFDCFNVNDYDKGRKKRKAFQEPYRSADDDRIKVCIYHLYFYSIFHLVAH